MRIDLVMYAERYNLSCFVLARCLRQKNNDGGSRARSVQITPRRCTLVYLVHTVHYLRVPYLYLKY